MKKEIVYWLGLVFVVSLLMVACSGNTQAPQTEEPKPVESVATEEPTAESVATAESTAEIVVAEEPKITGPRTGEIAPDFTLPDSNGDMVHLADELNDNRIVILVFYYAHF
jgi:cytochrome oxidase Cu insertion factor (SCO1/SenC/PrrC family)